MLSAPFSSGHLCFRGLIQLRLGKRKSIGSCRLTSRTNFLLFNTKSKKEVQGTRGRGDEGQTREERKREKPQRASLGPVPSPGGRRAGPPALRLSWGCSAPSPAAAASRRRPLSARSLQPKGCEGSSPGHPLSPADSDGQQSRDTRCWLPSGDQSSVWSVFKQDGLGRALPSPPQAPPALAVPAVLVITGFFFALGKAKAERNRRAFPVPAEQRGLGGLVPVEGYLSLCLSFLNVSDSSLPLSQCLLLLAGSRPSIHLSSPSPRSVVYKGHEEAANSFPDQTPNP